MIRENKIGKMKSSSLDCVNGTSNYRRLMGIISLVRLEIKEGAGGTRGVQTLMGQSKEGIVIKETKKA